jgi:hypothetical protein
MCSAGNQVLPPRTTRCWLDGTETDIVPRADRVGRRVRVPGRVRGRARVRVRAPARGRDRARRRVRFMLVVVMIIAITTTVTIMITVTAVVVMMLARRDGRRRCRRCRAVAAVGAAVLVLVVAIIVAVAGRVERVGDRRPASDARSSGPLHLRRQPGDRAGGRIAVGLIAPAVLRHRSRALRRRWSRRHPSRMLSGEGAMRSWLSTLSGG